MKSNLEGLVFSVPLADSVYGFGQVIKKKEPIYYMAAFDITKSSPEVTKSEIQNAKIIGLGNFFDILIMNGRWPHVGYMSIPDVPFPCYKYFTSGEYVVKDWEGNFLRIAADDEIRLIPNESNCSGMVFESFLKIKFGLEEYSEFFSGIDFKDIEKASKLI